MSHKRPYPAVWQPIDTAPKDGTIVDLWAHGEKSDAEFYCGVEASSNPRPDGLYEGRITRMFWDDGWRPASGVYQLPRLITMMPTHWMLPPLPPGRK